MKVESSWTSSYISFDGTSIFELIFEAEMSARSCSRGAMPTTNLLDTDEFSTQFIEGSVLEQRPRVCSMASTLTQMAWNLRETISEHPSTPFVSRQGMAGEFIRYSIYGNFIPGLIMALPLGHQYTPSPTARSFSRAVEMLMASTCAFAMKTVTKAVTAISVAYWSRQARESSNGRQSASWDPPVDLPDTIFSLKL